MQEPALYSTGDMSADNPFLPTPSLNKRSRLPVFLSWIIILGMASAIVYANIRSMAAADYQNLLNAERERMVGMIVVQMKSVQKDASGSALIGDRMEQLISQIEEEARTAEDRIRIAILAGEAFGADAALTRLSRIDNTASASEVEDDVRSIQTIYEKGTDALPATDKEDLVRRHGYLGRLALAHDVPADREPRRTVQAEALQFTVRITLLIVGLVALSGLSLLLFGAGLVWFIRGKARLAYVRGTAGGAFVEAFALYLVLFAVLSLLFRFLGSHSVQWTWTALLILPIVWVWVGLRGVPAEQRLQAFGWYRGRGFLREAGAGIAGYIAGLVVIAFGFLLTYVLVRYTGVTAGSPIIRELDGGPWHMVGLYALACVFAPVMEETMFRGALFHHLRQRWGWAPSAFLVSVLFAALHPQGWVAVPALVSIAMVLAALREWRGSLIAPMAAHAFSNFLVLTAALVLLK
jgi:membrane protease YdiL (CAAX protease family)